MPKAAKTKKVSKKSTRQPIPVEMPAVTSISTSPVITPPRLNPKFLTYGLVVLAIALLVYKFGPWLVPAVVNNRPITRFALWSRLEKTYGAQTFDDLINEAILDHAIAQTGIQVEQAKIDDQITSLEEQFKEAGGLDAALTERGLTRTELIKQIRTQLAVEELLADKITPTEAEIKQEFDDNATTTYQGQKFEDVKESIIQQLKDSKIRDEFLTWFAETKKSVKVKNFGL